MASWFCTHSGHSRVVVSLYIYVLSFSMDTLDDSGCMDPFSLKNSGSTFRIYQIGSLEVRTTQMKFGQEKVGAMFSSGASGRRLGPKKG